MSVYIENNHHNNISQCLPTCEASSEFFTGRIIGTINFWTSRSRQRKQLSRLDARMLMDIGITAEQVKAEIAKPFWK